MRTSTIDGLPVIDAKRPITITVNANDIARADKKEPADCAVARACRRELHAKEVRVHLGRVYVRTTPDKWTRYMTPKSMRAEIISFDRGGTFEPGEFHLSPPSPTKRASGKRQGTAKGQNKRGKKYAPRHTITNVRLGPA